MFHINMKMKRITVFLDISHLWCQINKYTNKSDIAYLGNMEMKLIA